MNQLSGKIFIQNDIVIEIRLSEKRNPDDMLEMNFQFPSQEKLDEL
jgi:hypothetical protein